MTRIHIVEGIEGARSAQGAVVVIDVLRAFTTAAYAFDQGLEEIALVVDRFDFAIRVEREAGRVISRPVRTLGACAF